MAIAYVTTLRNTRMDAINTAANAGAGAALLRVYDGTRPATGGTATTLLAELTFSDPAFGASASGVLTASSITQDSSANATGTASWFRVVDSAGNAVMDGNCGTSGSDLNLTTLSIVSTQPVSCSSFVLTEGNP
jgi:hypothetical protein